MKQNWEIKKMSEVCSKITDGTHKTPKYVENGIRFISIRNIKPFKPIDWNAYVKYISEEEHKELIKRCNPEMGDILFPRIGTLGYAKKIDFEDKVSLFVGLGLAKPNRDLIDSSFLEYYLNTPFIYELSHEMATGAGRQTLALASSKEFPVPVPPLPEQERIVAKLDQCFEAIDQAKANVGRNLQNAKELFQSQLNLIFTRKGEGWEERKLGDLGEITSSKRIYKREYIKEGIPFYRTKEIKELANEKEISLELYISREKYREIKKTFGVPSEGDILISAVGTIGEIYVVRKGDEFYFKDGNLLWLKDFNDVDTNYLKYALISYVDQIKALSRGSAYNALTIEKLKEYIVNLPSLEIQKLIVTKLDKLKRETLYIESNYVQELKVLDELKNSILQKAFNGEL